MSFARSSALRAALRTTPRAARSYSLAARAVAPKAAGAMASRIGVSHRRHRGQAGPRAVCAVMSR